MIGYQMENTTYRAENIRGNILSLVDGLSDKMHKKGRDDYNRDEYRRRKKEFSRFFQKDIGIADALDAVDFNKLRVDKDLFTVDRDDVGWVLKSEEMEIEVKGLTPADLQDGLGDWITQLYLNYQEREPEYEIENDDERAKWHRQKQRFDQFFPGETERLANQ